MRLLLDRCCTEGWRWSLCIVDTSATAGMPVKTCCGGVVVVGDCEDLMVKGTALLQKGAWSALRCTPQYRDRLSKGCVFHGCCMLLCVHHIQVFVLVRLCLCFQHDLHAAHMHGPHLDHCPFCLAVSSASVRLGMTPGDVLLKDGSPCLLVGSLGLQFTAYTSTHTPVNYTRSSLFLCLSSL